MTFIVPVAPHYSYVVNALLVNGGFLTGLSLTSKISPLLPPSFSSGEKLELFAWTEVSQVGHTHTHAQNITINKHVITDQREHYISKNFV